MKRLLAMLYILWAAAFWIYVFTYESPCPSRDINRADMVLTLPMIMLWMGAQAYSIVRIWKWSRPKSEERPSSAAN